MAAHLRSDADSNLIGRSRTNAGLTSAPDAFITQPMSKTIRLRNVPDALHRRLKARAAMSGLPLSDYLIHELRKIAEQNLFVWPGCSHLPMRAPHRRIKGATLIGLADSRPLPLPLAIHGKAGMRERLRGRDLYHGKKAPTEHLRAERDSR
jgi:hypothetical protein